MRSLNHAGLFLKRFPKVRIFRLIDNAEFGRRQLDSVHPVDIPFVATIGDVLLERVSSMRSLYQDRILSKVERLLHKHAFGPTRCSVSSSIHRAERSHEAFELS